MIIGKKCITNVISLVVSWPVVWRKFVFRDIKKLTKRSKLLPTIAIALNLKF